MVDYGLTVTNKNGDVILNNVDDFMRLWSEGTSEAAEKTGNLRPPSVRIPLPEPIPPSEPVFVVCRLVDPPLGAGWFEVSNGSVVAYHALVPEGAEGVTTEYKLYVRYTFKPPDQGSHGLALYRQNGELIYNSNIPEMRVLDVGTPEDGQIYYSTDNMNGWFSISTSNFNFAVIPDGTEAALVWGTWEQKGGTLVESEDYYVNTGSPYRGGPINQGEQSITRLFMVEDTSF